MNRRQFVKLAASAGVAFQAAPYILAQSEGRKLKVALIGSGWWGKNILKEAMASGRCQVVALCDVDANTLEVAADKVNDLSGDKPKTFSDHRELLEKAKPDIAIIASPDHWHALQTIDALKSGSHVFVEKPTGQTVNESRAMLKTARKSGRHVPVDLER